MAVDTVAFKGIEALRAKHVAFHSYPLEGDSNAKFVFFNLQEEDDEELEELKNQLNNHLIKLLSSVELQTPASKREGLDLGKYVVSYPNLLEPACA